MSQRVKEERLRAGLTLERLAEASDISPSFLAYIEKGRKKPSLQTLWKISQALDLSLGRLLDLPSKTPAPARSASKQFDFLLRDKSTPQKKKLLRALHTLLKHSG
ncbi:MAG: helix-turn-helix transcriptional regulator [Elusimicrobiota bacterium]